MTSTSQSTGKNDVLRDEVINVLKGVLIHQRQRWSVLLRHQRQREAWWKAEFAMALESWAWSIDSANNSNAEIKNGISGEYGVYTEVKLGQTDSRVDLLVAPWPAEKKHSGPPRVWIELKERGTWWGNANKALGEANQGLRHDLKKLVQYEKFDDADSVLLCHLVSHETPGDSGDGTLPEKWSAAFADDALRKPYTSFRVGCHTLVRDPHHSLENDGQSDTKPDEDNLVPGTLWLRMDIYLVR